MRASIAHRVRPGLLSFGTVALLAVTAATAQVATAPPGSTGFDSSGAFTREAQACALGMQGDRDACLREARAAQADKRRGALDAGTPDYQANAAARCEPLSGEEKAACQARVMGYGQASGSVAGGGLLRSVETVVLPPGQSEVTIEPKTADPVVVVPAR